MPLENSTGGTPLKFDEWCTHDLFPPIMVMHSACIMYDTKNTWPNSLLGGSFTHLWFYNAMCQSPGKVLIYWMVSSFPVLTHVTL